MAETHTQKNLPLNPKAREFIPASLRKLNSPSNPLPKHLIPPHWRNLPPRLLWEAPKNRRRSFPNPKVVKKKTFLGGNTSVMLRNIPNALGRSDLLRILDSHCGKENSELAFDQPPSSYDFLYLPMDFVKHANLGYAFVNFTTSIAAERFYRKFHSLPWNYHRNNQKICKISAARFQGKHEMSQHFKDSKFPCHTQDYLPVLLSPPSDGFTSYRLTTLGHRVHPA